MVSEEEIKIPIYGISILLVITQETKKYIIEAGIDEEPDTCDAHVYNTMIRDDIPYDFVTVLKPNRLKENIIAHEAFHLTAQIMRALDTPLIDETEETYAYLLDYIYKIVRHRTVLYKTKNQQLNEEENGDTSSRKETTAATSGSN